MYFGSNFNNNHENIKFEKIFSKYMQGSRGMGHKKWSIIFEKYFYTEVKKSDKIEKNNFSQNLDHYCFGPPANRTPLTISYKNQWKIEKNRVQGKKPCTFFRYLQSHFSRNSPLITKQDDFFYFKNILISWWFCTFKDKTGWIFILCSGDFAQVTLVRYITV